jgi:hypothetical protein
MALADSAFDRGVEAGFDQGYKQIHGQYSVSPFAPFAPYPTYG